MLKYTLQSKIIYVKHFSDVRPLSLLPQLVPGLSAHAHNSLNPGRYARPAFETRILTAKK